MRAPRAQAESRIETRDIPPPAAFGTRRFHAAFRKPGEAAGDTTRPADRLYLSEGGNDTSPVCGSLWTAYNGITEMVDHGPSRNRERHLESIWLGSGYLLKVRAFEAAKDFVKEETRSSAI